MGFDLDYHDSFSWHDHDEVGLSLDLPHVVRDFQRVKHYPI
jgi:hypothetical protein